MATFKSFGEKAEPSSWLWPGTLPLGELCLVDGDPGVGKSLFALDIAARTSRGRDMPLSPGTAAMGAGVIICCREEQEDRITERLASLDADMTKVTKLVENKVRLPEDEQDLLAEITRQKARLLFMDPIPDFLTFPMGASYLRCREGLLPFRELAERAKIVILGTRHLIKDETIRPVARGQGGMGLPSVARATFEIGRTPNDPNYRFFKPRKFNHGPTPPTRYFEIEGGNLRLNWVESIPTAPMETAQTAVSEAEQFLLLMLDGLPYPGLPNEEVRREARRAAVSESAVRRARYSLGVRSICHGVGSYWRLWYWYLPPEEESSGRARCHPRTTGLPAPGALVPKKDGEE